MKGILFKNGYVRIIDKGKDISDKYFFSENTSCSIFDLVQFQESITGVQYYLNNNINESIFADLVLEDLKVGFIS